MCLLRCFPAVRSPARPRGARCREPANSSLPRAVCTAAPWAWCGRAALPGPMGCAPWPPRSTCRYAPWRCIRRAASSASTAASAAASPAARRPPADAEWREWQYKRPFVERASMPFELLETLALEDAAFRHLPEHLARLRGAAAHFGVPGDADAVQQCLRALAQRHLAQRWRVRLLLDAAGRPRAEAFALHAAAEPVRLALATRAFTAAHSEFVRYKTTRRAHYAAFAPTVPGVFDTLLWNEAGEITESTFGNIAAYIDGRWVTPPCCCGLLPGVGRAVALREGRVAEAVLRLTDRPRVQGWAFINSLRGWLAATVQ